MLTWRGRGRRGERLVVAVDGRREQPKGSGDGVILLDEECAFFHVWVVGQLVDGVDRGAGHVGLEEQRDPLVSSSRSEDLRELAPQLLVAARVVANGVARLRLEEVGTADCVAEIAPEFSLGRLEQHDALVRRSVVLVPDGRGKVDATRCLLPTRAGEGLGLPRDRGVELRDVEAASNAGGARPNERGADGHPGVERCGVHTDSHVRRNPRLAVGGVVDGRCEPCEGVVCDAVGGKLRVGAPTARSRQRAVHDRGLERAQLVVAGAAALGGAGAKPVDDDVGTCRQPVQELASARLLAVEGEAALAPVPAQVHEGHAARLVRAELPDVVAPRRLLDLDDVGAEVREVHAEQVGCEERELEHPNTGEKRVRHASRSRDRFSRRTRRAGSPCGA